MFLVRWKFFRLIREFNIDVESADLLKVISVAISDHKKKKKITLGDLQKVEKMFMKGKNK